MSVSSFYRDEKTREQVIDYIKTYIAKAAKEKVFAREDVSHIADAMELIESAFGQMEVDFAPKKEVINNSPR